MRTALLWLGLSALAVLFILQQVYVPLVTVWVALAEFFHSSSFLLLLHLLLSNGGFRGLSVKTQLLFAVVYWTRYVDSFFAVHPNHWIKVLKLFYMAASLAPLLALRWLYSTWERQKDSCSLTVIFVLSFLLGGINWAYDSLEGGALERIVHFFWICSHYLQGFAMLPQFIFCYRDLENGDRVLTGYILLLSAYRLLYAFNWIQRAYQHQFYYLSGPLGLLILCVFLADFLLYKWRRKSCISNLVLKLDDSLQISRLPLLAEDYDRVPTDRRWGGGFSSGVEATDCRGVEMHSLEVSVEEGRVLGKSAATIAKGIPCAFEKDEAFSEGKCAESSPSTEETTSPPPGELGCISV